MTAIVLAPRELAIEESHVHLGHSGCLVILLHPEILRAEKTNRIMRVEAGGEDPGERLSAEGLGRRKRHSVPSNELASMVVRF